MPLEHVPIIDIAPYRNGSEASKWGVAEQIGEACRDNWWGANGGSCVDSRIYCHWLQVSGSLVSCGAPGVRAAWMN